MLPGRRGAVICMAVVLCMAVVVVAGLTSAVPASAAGSDSRRTATATVRALELHVAGSKMAIAASSASIDGSPAASATAAGVVKSKKTVAAAKVTAINKREAARECLAELAVSDVVRVVNACGESRVQTLPKLLPADYPRHTGAALLDPEEARRQPRSEPIDNGGPQAVGRATVAAVDLHDRGVLDRITAELRALLDALAPLRARTVESAAGTLGPPRGTAVRSLAADLGLGPNDVVEPVVAVLGQVLESTGGAGLLASITLADSSAQANTDADEAVALASTGGGRVDLFPGAAPGDPPFLSITVGPATSGSRYDRATADRSPTVEPAEIRVSFPPRTGVGTGEVVVPPDRPVTLFAGTPLETTVTPGRGRTARNPDGSVSSIVEPTTVQLLKGATELEVGRAATALGARFDPRRSEQPPTGVGRRPVVLAAAVLAGAGVAVVLVCAVRRRSSSESG